MRGSRAEWQELEASAGNAGCMLQGLTSDQYIAFRAVCGRGKPRETPKLDHT